MADAKRSVASTPPRTAPALVNDFPEVSSAASEVSPPTDPEEATVGASHEKNAFDGDDETHEYPSLLTLIPITACLCLCVFVVALDRLIIATAIPQITNEYHSLGDIGWYGSSYLLTSCSFQLLYGRIYTFYNTKRVFLVALSIFGVGSAICGAAPSSATFIIGRAIGGLGSSGIFRYCDSKDTGRRIAYIFSGSTLIIMHTMPLHKRPIYLGFIGGMFGIASVAGPLLVASLQSVYHGAGGKYVDYINWLW